MEFPLEFTWTFPKFNGIGFVRVEEFPQFVQDGNSVNLKGVDITIEDFLGCMDGVGYDDNFGDII